MIGKCLLNKNKVNDGAKPAIYGRWPLLETLLVPPPKLDSIFWASTPIYFFLQCWLANGSHLPLLWRMSCAGESSLLWRCQGGFYSSQVQPTANGCLV